MKRFYTLFAFFVVLNTNSFSQEVDELPYFAGCDSYKPKSKEKEECSKSNLSYYLNRNLVYPDNAKQQNISGVVYTVFTVEADGKVSKVSVLNDIGGGCGDIAKQIVEKMPIWEPAKLNGKNVPFELRLPIHFKLDNADLSRDFNLFWGDIQVEEISKQSIERNLREPIIIRNTNGEAIKPINLMLVYEHNKSIKTIKSKGEIDKNMIKILKKAKPDSKITFVVTLQKKGSFFELFKTFSIK